MKTYIDFSIVTKIDGAHSNVSGVLEFDVLPNVGDEVSLTFTPKGRTTSVVKSFFGNLVVEKRIFHFTVDPISISIVLSDIELDSAQDAAILGEILKEDFGLIVG